MATEKVLEILSGAISEKSISFLTPTDLKLPFYVAAGTLDEIGLTADNKIPFFKADGNASNISLTT